LFESLLLAYAFELFVIGNHKFIVTVFISNTSAGLVASEGQDHESQLQFSLLSVTTQSVVVVVVVQTSVQHELETGDQVFICLQLIVQAESQFHSTLQIDQLSA